MRPRPLSEAASAPALAVALALSCGSPPSPTAPAFPTTPRQCDEGKQRLLRVLRLLPAEGRHVEVQASLPIAPLDGVVGAGGLLEIDGERLRLDGSPLDGASKAQRLEALRRALVDRPPEAGRLYVAAERSLYVNQLRAVLESVPAGVEPRLVFSSPLPAQVEQEDWTRDIRLAKTAEDRKVIAEEAYRAHAKCPAIHAAVAAAADVLPARRWSVLRVALREAIERCDCADLDARGLEQLLIAEQRAGAATLGSIPIAFARDARCGASIPLQSMQWLVDEVTAFDEEFSGAAEGQEVQFETVIDNDRLLNYLCQALPGETVAAVQRARGQLYFRPHAEGAPAAPCQAWGFRPLTPISAMGNWTGATAEGGVRMHYWLGAEEIRVYGPAPDASSKATDAREWACAQELGFVGIDQHSVHLEDGSRWYFDEASCEAETDPATAVRGCIARAALGLPIPPAESLGTEEEQADREAVDPASSGQSHVGPGEPGSEAGNEPEEERPSAPGKESESESESESER